MSDEFVLVPRNYLEAVKNAIEDEYVVNSSMEDSAGVLLDFTNEYLAAAPPAAQPSEHVHDITKGMANAQPSNDEFHKFVVKYGFEPDEAMQIHQDGKWWVEKREGTDRKLTPKIAAAGPSPAQS